MSLEVFHPLVRDWFSSRFAGPTGVQERGWRAIAAGRHALLTAPTGSGKTLAAFLHCLDRLVRAGLQGRIDDVPCTVYVSPLKALSNDIHLNLRQPLDGLTALAMERGLELEPIRVAVRTGDTPAADRRAAVKNPPHLWITTPESLYILMTSDSGRRALASTGTVIVDEIHALADDKRGAHLSLTLERLADLTGRPLQRIGLSATVHPIDEVARFLLGAGERRDADAAAPPDCVIVDEGRGRALDLGVEMPRCELGPIATQAIWDDTLDRIAALTREHRTTIVFTNTRRLVERVAHQLAARLGEEAVAPHHGSLSRAIRLRSEERLKSGAARVCVATASLELGIDVGTIDLVCQIGSPRSVSVALQRIGRSGHALGRTPKGRLFPLTRDELVECAALLALARRGEIDRLEVPRWPLDVLAQQIAAECAAAGEARGEEDLYASVRRAWPYRDLPRARFDEVVAMLSEGVATARGRRGALLHRDGVHGKLRARRGTRLLALTSGGAIPDNADYDVVKDPEGMFVGRVNEDFAIESLAGDVFLLGNAAWQIRRVERGRVRVEAAPGATPTVPFWLGEAPGRTRELSAAVGRLREEVDTRASSAGDSAGSAAAAQAFLEDETGIHAEAARAIVDFIAEGKRVLGVVPTAGRIVAERFFDETGGMQLVIHAPLGSRINRAWGLALRKRFCRTFDFELQAAATDDGINLSLGPQHSFPLGEVFRFVKARGVEEVLAQAVLPSPIFTARWRWTVTRSLQVPRWEGGRKVPPPLLRMRSDDLLAAVFPAQAGCQDNAPGGDIAIPDHPLVFETLRDCLEEALDVEGLKDTLQEIEAGRIDILARDTLQPSVFAHSLLNAMPYAFLDDAPLEERRARAVNLRRALPEDAADLGRLDPQAVRAASEDAWPRPRDAEELHEALLGLILLPLEMLEARFPAAAGSWFEDLEADGRTVRLRGAAATSLAAAECEEAARAALTGAADPLARVVRGWSEVMGPFTAASLGRDLGLPEGIVTIACATLEADGTLLRGAFTDAGASGEEWCDRRILARIHRATIQTLRREIEPVPASIFLRFLATWQHAAPGSGGHGADGLLQAIELLQGFEAPVAAWESALLPARVERYDPEDLDRLLLGGQIVWGRFSARPEGGPGGMTRASLVSLALREDLPWLLDSEAPGPPLSSRAAALFEWVQARGPSYPADAAKALALLPSEMDDAMAELIAAGLATLDGFAALRRLASASARRGASAGRRAGRFVRRRGAGTAAGDGRLWLFDRETPAPEDRMTQRAAQLLRRWGVLFRDLLAREGTAPAWRELLPELRRAEARGEVRGGRFVDGVPGEQFALSEAVEALRAARRQGPGDAVREISAADPLNLAGILTPGPRIPALARGRVVLHDGVPAASAEAR
jgi:ATP-dependent Lhr-like helicase